MVIVNDKEKEFLLDAIKFLELKYSVNINDFKNEMLPDESNESFLYRKLDKFIFKNLYNIGKEDYGIDFSYEQFLDSFIEGHRTNDSFFRRRWFWGRHYEPSKYQKKPHHQKKEKSIEEINKENWRREKKKKTNRSYRWDYDREWDIKRQDKEMKKEASEELREFLDNSSIDIKGLKLSL